MRPSCGVIGANINAYMSSPIRPTYVGGTAQGFNGTSGAIAPSLNTLTGGIATAPAAGDLIVFCYAISSATQFTFTTPSGYTLLSQVYSNDTYDSNLAVYYKVAAAGETSVALTASGSTTAGMAFIAQVWRNVNTTFASFPIELATLNTFVPPFTQYQTPATKYSVQFDIVASAVSEAGTLGTLPNYTTTYAYDKFLVTHGKGSSYSPIVGFGSKIWDGNEITSAPVWTRTATDNTSNAVASVNSYILPKSYSTTGTYFQSDIYAGKLP